MAKVYLQDIELAKASDVSTKQDTLVSGENIKTINNQSLLGSGNIEIEGSTVEYATTEEAMAAVQEVINARS